MWKSWNFKINISVCCLPYFYSTYSGLGLRDIPYGMKWFGCRLIYVLQYILGFLESFSSICIYLTNFSGCQKVYFFFFFIKLLAATTTQHLKGIRRTVDISASITTTSFMALPIISFDCVNYYCERSWSKNGILHLSIFQAHIRNRIRRTKT